MDANAILRIRSELTRYLKHFDVCFGRITARQHLDTYVAGQLGPLQRKSVEPMADAAGVPSRNLQQFLSLYRWDEALMRDRHQQRVAARFADPHAVGIIDETSFVKKGTHTAGVQRQHCGALGKRENCVVSVHLGYATPDFHTMLDGELYLPEESWHEDRERCRAAGIPDEVVYRPKWQIALEQLRRARSNGIRFKWLTFDEGYGGKPPFLRELDAFGQNYLAEVPRSFRVWTRRPDVLHREHDRHRRMGRPAKLPRLKVKNNPTAQVQDLLTHSPKLREQAWENYRVKQGTKGPMVWQVKRLTVWLEGENGLPGAPHGLIVARNALDPEEVKFFLSNAPVTTSSEELLLVAFSRWKIERLFEDGKSELGLDHFEVRKYLCLRRHLIVSCLSYQFLAEFHARHRGEKPTADDLPGPHGHGEAGADLDRQGPMFASVCRVNRRAVGPDPTPQCQGEQVPSQENAASPAHAWPSPSGHEDVSLATLVAV